ncbi:MAG: divergent polysaccharide deacetylase family protein [Gemmatimonadaceae bacterium]
MCRSPFSRFSRIALVIDDFGYADESIISGFMLLDIPFTAAVLPYQPFSTLSAEAAHTSAREVLLHLPMQGRDGKDAGPDALLDALSEAELRARTRKAMRSVPFLVGANNHMGSVLTADSTKMRWVLEELQKQNLFFFDSRTTDKSVGETMARSIGVPTAARRVFLDNVKEFASIEAEWTRAVRFAERDGSALVIGHVYPKTLAALRVLVPQYAGRLQFVAVSEVVH